MRCRLSLFKGLKLDLRFAVIVHPIMALLGSEPTASKTSSKYVVRRLFVRTGKVVRTAADVNGYDVLATVRVLDPAVAVRLGAGTSATRAHALGCLVWGRGCAGREAPHVTVWRHMQSQVCPQGLTPHLQDARAWCRVSRARNFRAWSLRVESRGFPACGIVPGDQIAWHGTVSCEFQNTNLFFVCGVLQIFVPSRRS